MITLYSDNHHHHHHDIKFD